MSLMILLDNDTEGKIWYAKEQDPVLQERIGGNASVGQMVYGCICEGQTFFCQSCGGKLSIDEDKRWADAYNRSAPV